MVIYPYNTPIIMTDDLFTAYGGKLDGTTPLQRQAAFTIAEQALSHDLGTFLLPTIVTGTYNFASKYLKGGLLLDWGYVTRVISTTFIDQQDNAYWSQAGTSNYYVNLKDDVFGLIDVNWLLGRCGCPASQYPYKIQVVYQAGLPTGTANQPNILLGLKTYTEILLNEMIGFGNEAPGDVGVLRYSNQDYREERVGLVRTCFGDSAKANFVHKLILGTGLKKYTWCGL